MEKIDPQGSLKKLEGSDSPTSGLNPLRTKTIAYLVVESRKARGLPSFDEPELKSVVFSWSRALRDIPTEDLQACYDRAIADYTEPEKPFGTPQLLKGWQSVLEERRQRKFATRNDRLAQTGTCRYCNSTGWQNLMDRPGHTCVRPCACEAAPASTRSAEPLCEPQWQLEKAGRWWTNAAARAGVVSDSSTERTTQ